ncbi:hypothetical protein DACRYDRAFT_104450 [Dacryopinax primogenitus]|uniref:TPR-like protein n=1 Tax=Dacryopinax primogenitus (strain DJM 731) TaxID=1858805 RepID=M5G2W0_DACPD|nr:uncharacterized protein DACRYDRAFT_104450 [Dacryopinax primogenitus]EJU04566.1 hypothetical protein DACRYDRAFT_104450 [Dacryopinax primogenitus]
MQEAANYQRLALTGVHPSSRLFPYAKCATNACISFCNLCEEGGDPKHSDEAITFGYEALRIFPEQAEEIPIAFAALGWSYRLRYSLSGDDKDFKHAIGFLEQASDASKNRPIPWAKHGMPDLYRNFTCAYGQKFRRDRERADLDRAIELGQICVDSSPLISHKAAYLSYLGELLLYRYELSGNQEDLIKSTAAAETALEQSFNTGYQRPAILVRYARTLRRLFDAMAEPKHIERAITYVTEALEKYSNVSFAHKTPYLSELAAAYQARFKKFGARRDLLTALDTYEIASTNLSAAVKDRIEAAVAGGMLAYTTGCVWAAAKGYCVAVALLPRLAWVGMNTRDRQKKVTFASGALACNAAAASIEINNLQHAIELLEHGRSMIWRSTVTSKNNDTSRRKGPSPFLVGKPYRR